MWGIDGIAIAKELREKSTHVTWMADSRTDYFVVLARGFMKAIKDEEMVIYVDLATLARFFEIREATP